MQKVVFNTNGSGLWSKVAKGVQIVDMRLHVQFAEKDFGELCVYFNTDTWNVEKDGLVYTDELFMFQLQQFLDEHGLDCKDVGYSEAGMQGDDYVSCDVGESFIAKWEAKFGILEVE